MKPKTNTESRTTGDYCVKFRKIQSQNVVHRLRDREMYDCRRKRPNPRIFYKNVFPNYTIVHVEKPPCFLRKFSPDGKYLVAFSADQLSLEVYEYKGCSQAGNLLKKVEGDVCPLGTASNLRGEIFDKLFKLKHSVNLHMPYSSEQLNRECSLFTCDGKYVVVGSGAFIMDEARPQFYDIYTNNESVTPNNRLPLEDITLYLVNLEEGRMCDRVDFPTDKIYLSHNQGLCLHNDRLAVLSVQHQTIYVYLVKDECFELIKRIGRFCYESDWLLVSMPRQGNDIGLHRPFKETAINSLKHRLLAFLFRKAKNAWDESRDPYPLRKFYSHFDQLKELRIWKMQLLDENHILIKYSTEDVVVLKATDTNSQPALFVVYNIFTTNVIAVYENISEELLYILENYTDYFRNARLDHETRYTCSPANNVYAKLALQRFKYTITSARYGGHTEAIRRLSSQLPISAQSYSSTPYLDLSLFSYDEKWISPMERPKACAEHPIRFYDRESGILKFKMFAGIHGRNAPAAVRRLVAFIFHPTDPFAISVQRTNAEYVVNFHIRQCQVENTEP